MNSTTPVAATVATTAPTISLAAPRHAVLELLSRYKAVAQQAWAQRAELAGPRRLADEAAFLPAALSLQDTPVHPSPRRAMWAVMALFAVALAWACIGKVDIVAVAPGRIVVVDGTKLVQPLETAVVRAIHVRDGDVVQAGQLLVELDPTNASADHASVQDQLQTAVADAQRAQALQTAWATRTAPKLPLAPAPVQALLATEWQDLQAKRARLQAETARRSAELATAQQQLAKLQTLAPLARQREADVARLGREGYVSNHLAQDRTRERLELERDQATQSARVAEAQAALAESRTALQALGADLQKTLGDRAEQARLKTQQLNGDASKTRQREQLTRLTAPVAGTVQQLATHTAGGVVTAAQTLMVVVPTNGAVTAQVEIDNKDMGFVQVGQKAELKMETFNFTRYGLVPAVVTNVSRDAVVNDKTGAVFVATLALQGGTLRVGERDVRLSPGMNLSAEIKTGRRRVIEFLTSGLWEEIGRSGRER